MVKMNKDGDIAWQLSMWCGGALLIATLFFWLWRVP